VFGESLSEDGRPAGRKNPIKPHRGPQLRDRQASNKRTAIAATYTFLAINGARLTADAQETYVFVAAIYEANQFSFDKLVPWLRSHVTQNPSADEPG
jgi:hypothetical protein